MGAARQIVAIGSSRGGVADVFARAVVELRARGHTVEVLTVARDGAPARAGIAAVLRARDALRSADTVHIEFGANDSEVFWAGLAATRLRRDCVVVAHDHPELAHAPGAALVPDRDRSRLRRALAYRLASPLLDPRLDRALLARAGVLVVLGEKAAEERRAAAAGPREIVVIRHGADPPAAGLAPPSRGESILFAGFIGPSKGVDVLVRAWAELRQDVSLPLVLAGPADPPNDVWLDSLTAPLVVDGAPNPPRVLGAVDGEADFAALIGSAAVVVLPYRHSSPASGILVRAMAAGRAIVATPTPAVSEVIRDGENGLVVPAGDPRALAEALRRLADDPALRDRLGAAAAATAAAEFRWEAQVDGLERAYARATGASAA
jgi:glycosyltransferase involved in cell wall biosynthesis